MSRKYGLRVALDMEAVRARKQWRQAKLKTTPKCPVCKQNFGKRKPATVDHIVPLSKGGADNKSNWQLMCRACNMKRGAD